MFIGFQMTAPVSLPHHHTTNDDKKKATMTIITSVKTSNDYGNRQQSKSRVR